MSTHETSTRKTKIIWSLEGKTISDTNAALSQIENSSFDTLRLVYTKETSEDIIKLLKTLTAKEKSGQPHIPIMLDVAAQARAHVCQLEENLEFNYDDKITIVCDETTKSTKSTINIRTNVWNELFAADAKIYFGFGDMAFSIDAIEPKKIHATALQVGRIFPDMEVHVPTTRKIPSIQFLNDIDLSSFSSFQIDYVVLPGISSSREVSIIKKKIQSVAGTVPWLIVKVDSLHTYEELPNVIDSYDGILMSRRELAISSKPSSIPMLTKEIIQLANQHAKLVISASDILGSMRNNPTPTRAEVSDIANSVIDGVDAILLSQDLCHGKHMLRALEVCNNAIMDIETHKEIETNWIKDKPRILNEFDAIAFQAYMTAKRVNAKAIVCITKSGHTALRLASFRQDLPIFAVTFSEDTRKKLSLVRGVEGIVMHEDLSLSETFPAVGALLKKSTWLASGDTILLVSVTISSMSEQNSNLMTIQRIA